MQAFAHPIQTVSRLTGLSPFLIRIWEKRYGAVVPSRTPTNRRLYSQEQIEKLGLLRTLTQVGHPIGMLANLPVENLRRMAADSDFAAPRRGATSAEEISGPCGSPDPAPGLIDGCLAAVEAFDSPALDKALRRAEVMLGSQGALQRVVAPLACALGEHWRSGRITAAHEHFCSAALKGWLAQATRSYSAPGNGPGVVVGTPAGQRPPRSWAGG
jgi:MerR family transcriptional regulator, light-induced transcriptional regulator